MELWPQFIDRIINEKESKNELLLFNFQYKDVNILFTILSLSFLQN